MSPRLTLQVYLIFPVVIASPVIAAEPAPLKVKSQTVSFPQPHEDKAVYEMAAYSTPKGPEMVRLRTEEIKDDITSNYEFSFSNDHGETWSDSMTMESSKQTDKGMFRRMFFNAPFCDPRNGRLLLVGEEGVLPADNSLDAFMYLYTVYIVSEDQGRTWTPSRRVIHRGKEFSAEHPLPTVYVGKNASQTANAYRSRSDGAVIVPTQLSILKDGKLYLPPGAFTYLDGAFLFGHWQPDGSLEWELSDRLHLPPEKSLRGAFEPTIAEFPDGRTLVILRANDGHKWYAVSRDKGMTWDELRHWTYTDGTEFYSPSSLPLLLKHSDGTVYWFGNITPDKPSGNAPRYPLVVGRVDPKSLLLIKESLTTIDTKKQGDSGGLQLSNFHLVEDRRNGDFLLRMTRWDGAPSGLGKKTSGSVHLYRVGQ